MDGIRFVVADDHKLFLKGFRLLLDQMNKRLTMICLGEAGNIPDVLRLIQADPVDLLFLDLNLGDADSGQMIPKFKELHPQLRILCISMYTDSKVVRDVLKKGADGFLSKNAEMLELENAIETVMDGEIFMGSDIKLTDVNRKNVQSKLNINRFNAAHQLTKREKEILDLVAKGKSNKDIAALLFISKDTVSAHRKSLMRKLNVKNASGLIKAAYEFNLL
ncbi:MAG: response regulator transcription factor [Saprospiraceae bacterium]|nr:response regulator transcription factor [Saprospiraceae bacterium]